MEEENTQQEEQSVSPVIDAATRAAENLEKATEIYKKENDRREAIIAREKLGGYSNTTEKKEEPKEETAEEYAKRVMSGEIL